MRRHSREGIEVEVRLLTENASAEEEEEIPSLYERLKDVAGTAEELPPYLASNHDHYLHGPRSAYEGSLFAIPVSNFSQRFTAQCIVRRLYVPYCAVCG